MTEQEYQDVRDLGRVWTARQVLGEICVSIQPSIEESEFHAVHRLLEVWYARLRRDVGDLDEDEGEE